MLMKWRRQFSLKLAFQVITLVCFSPNRSFCSPLDLRNALSSPECFRRHSNSPNSKLRQFLRITVLTASTSSYLVVSAALFVWPQMISPKSGRQPFYCSNRLVILHVIIVLCLARIGTLLPPVLHSRKHPVSPVPPCVESSCVGFTQWERFAYNHKFH